MSINLNSIRDILNIKDVNISFSDNFNLKKKFSYVDSHFFFASLYYIPSACPCCGAFNIFNSIVKNGFMKFDSRVSNYVNVAIETCRRYEEFILNACRYKLSNGPLERKINKIKLIKTNTFGNRNFYNYKKRIIFVFEKFKYIENGPDISV